MKGMIDFSKDLQNVTIPVLTVYLYKGPLK